MKTEDSSHQDDDKSKKEAKFDTGRRRALQKIGIAAVAPMILPARLLAQKTAKSDAPPPSERLSIALIGLGGSMNSAIRILLANHDIFVHAVCDVDSRALKGLQANIMRAYRKDKNEYGTCTGTQDHREIIARDDIDGVVISTPVHWNAAIALDAIRAGKDVLIDSPMAMTMREGQLVRDAAMHHGAIAQVKTPVRCEDQFITLAELVRNGYLGDINEIYVEMKWFKEPDALPKQAQPKELDYDRWLGPAPYVHYHSARVAGGRVSGWRNFWDYGLRTHGSVGFDRYDIIQWALGKEDTGPVEFIPAGVDGQAYATFRYKDGPVVKLGHPVAVGQDIEFVGTQGSVSASTKGQLNSEPTEFSRIKIANGDIRLRADINVENSWVESVKSRSQPGSNASVGHRSSSICQLAAISDQVGRAIKWDPEKEEIIGDPIASRLLDRPRRAPYGLV